MKLNEINGDVPNATAGIQSVACTACSWEKVYILPEENSFIIGDLFSHLWTAHGIEVPPFTCTMY